MIKSHSDYIDYLEADRIALGKKKSRGFRVIVFPDPIWKFQRRMRKLEYYVNAKRSSLFIPYIAFLKYRFRKLSIKLGFSIPINVFGPGLAIVHYGTIVINANARVGKNCRIHVCTNIGASAGSSKAPVLGDNIYLAPGVKIYGDIKVANNVAFAANAAASKSIDRENSLYGGVPAKFISEIDIKKLIKHL